MRHNRIRRAAVVGVGAIGIVVIGATIALFVFREENGSESTASEHMETQQAETNDSEIPASLPDVIPDDTGAQTYLVPVTDVPLRRSLSFRGGPEESETSEIPEAVPALTTLAGPIAGRKIESMTEVQRHMLEALLRLRGPAGTRENDSESVSDLEELILPDARDYLIEEFRSELDAAGEATAAYGVDSGSPETIQFVLFFPDYALVVNLYLEDELIADGEVILREWSRQRTLAYP